MASKRPSNKIKSSSAATKQSGTELSGAGQFPVVGVGASAGGLEAFTQLFRHLPPDPGMAFVLIQHLAPAHESMLTELLSKTTAMPVKEVKDGMNVEPNNVYVIPPDSEMVIFHGVLHLTPREKARGQYMPVDSFLRSLSQDRRNNAIAVIMSGSGSDGSMGIRAVKGEGGIVFAQDETSKYDGMPKSAIATDCVDFVLPPDKIAAELLRIRRHPYLAAVRSGETAQIMPEQENDLNKIFIMLRLAKGVDFTSYKRSTIMRRINRRLLLQKIDGIDKYAAFLRKNPSEMETLYQDVLINVTSFFREPDAFEALKRSVFPRIVNKATGDAPVRIWVPACSTGEEAYSIAMTLAEYMDENKISRPVQLFATDIDDMAVEKARRGIYSENIVKDVSPERLKRFFEKNGAGYVINKSVREMCIFAKQNIVKDPPFSKIDLVSCRNVLIYFGSELQKKAIRILFYALNPLGFLMIGPSETVGEFAVFFSVVDRKNTIYEKKADAPRQYSEAPPAGYDKAKADRRGTEAQPGAVFNIQREADNIVIAKYSPAGFVVDDAMKVLQFRGDTGRYLMPAPGRASLDLLKMVSEELATELRTLLHQANKENIPLKKKRVGVERGKRTMYINIDVVPFEAPASGERYFLVLFEEIGNFPRPQSGPSTGNEVRLKQELAAAKAHLSSVTEEYEAANEELRALNEELQSGNEELQSINEEMETAKEELQSTNEELTTVNDELQSRNEETAQLNNDLFNVLRGVEIPIIILGNKLQVRRFNEAAARLLNLIPSDVGRPLSDIRTNINITDLEQMVRDVVNTLAVKEREVRDMEGRWYSLAMRPYKTADNRIDGVLMTLNDINNIKSNLLMVESAYDYVNSIVETLHEPLLVLAPDLRVITANRAFYETFLAVPEETVNKFIYDLDGRNWNIPALRNLLEKVLSENKVISDFEIELELPDLGRRVMILNARKIYMKEPYVTTSLNMSEHHDRLLILLAIEDITDRKETEEALKASADRYRFYMEVSGELGWITNANGEVAEDIPFWRTYTGQTYEEVKGKGWTKALHPDDLEHTLQAWEKAVSEKTGYEIEYRIRRQDGIYRDFMVKAIPVLNENGKVREWVGTCVDITERKKSEKSLEMLYRELQNTTEQLKIAYKDMESFNYSASHDLREPLVMIDWYSGSMLKKYGKSLDDAGRQMLTVIQQTSKKMELLMEALLSFSRTSTKDVKKSDIDMRMVVQDVLEDMRSATLKGDVKFVIGDLPPARADQSMIRQVLVNLLSNALKYTRPKEKALIKISGVQKGDEIVYSVKDNGIGFDMKLSEGLFGFFYRMRSPEEIEGSGIGLVIVKNIIGKHGGRVWAEGKPGKGAIFYFTLPRKTE